MVLACSDDHSTCTGNTNSDDALADFWINVNGETNAARADDFAAALADTARTVLAFGSPSLRSHGVYASGLARFHMLSLDIK